MNFETMISQMIGGMTETIGIFAWTLVFSLPFGLLIAFGRMSKYKWLSTIVKLYISIMRGTPLMLQLLVVFFGPYYLFRISMGGSWRFISIIIGFTLNYGAYFAEIFRSGIESMPIGQYEAAKLLGYSRIQTFFMIIFPQVIKRILPAMANEIITLVKDTSLAFSIAYMEMFTIAKQIAAANTTFVPFVIAAVFYYVFNLLVAGVIGLMEKKLNYYH